MRTDIHRPSVIDPADYDFVGVEYCRTEDFEDSLALTEERKMIARHKKRTGGAMSSHDHGGNCHICGAACIYTAIFHHANTNTYVRTGFDCAEKMNIGNPARFRAFRAAIHDARERQAGRHKAQAILVDASLSRAWELHEANSNPERLTELVELGAVMDRGEDWKYGRYQNTKEFSVLLDIVGKLVRYGTLSDGQERFLNTLVDRIDRRREIDAEREAERAAAEDCPSGRVQIVGKVLKVELRETKYGEQLKMTVKDDRGFLVWGTVPSLLATWGLEKGDRVKFTAAVTPSEDSKFGFFKRPTKASRVA